MDDTDDGTPESWGPRAEALAEELKGALPPLLWTRVMELVAAVEDHTVDLTVQVCEHRVARVLAYFPGLTPAWHAVSAHLETETLAR